ncbi:uncharacterized protein LOC107046598 [Diachasma alloeum]|uniref:uncharacterized protein LOC107046598 n=1 Tax=Diachasma alloeum TaxID=454923 RepID=UPI0007384900|nr:uncharacterized protein LOC107046598 [Diachasma alloeum]
MEKRSSCARRSVECAQRWSRKLPKEESIQTASRTKRSCRSRVGAHCRYRSNCLPRCTWTLSRVAGIKLFPENLNNWYFGFLLGELKRDFILLVFSEWSGGWFITPFAAFEVFILVEKCFLMFADMERLFVIVCALGAVRSEKMERSVAAEDYNHNYVNSNYHQRGVQDNRIDEFPINRAYDRQTEREAEYEIYRLLSSAQGPADMVKLDALGDHLISRANVTEEARRVVRQVKKQRPGFFWSLFKIAFEDLSDTVSTVQEIIRIVNKAITPPSTTTAKTPLATGPSNGTKTTTEAPFVLTAEGIATTIRRNLKGLIRLFNIEWKDAIDGSKVSIREFKKDLGKSIATSLADNPNAYV